MVLHARKLVIHFSRCTSDIMRGGFNCMGVHTECEGDTDRKFHKCNSEEIYLWPKTVSEVIPECNFLWREYAPSPLANVCYAQTECAHAVPM